MTDYQIAKNLGFMFENATRTWGKFDPKNVTLPPSITSFINSNYYNVETEFSMKEIIKGLESGNNSEKYAILKHLVHKIDKGDEDDSGNGSVENEIISIFPNIINNINTENLKIKRLVYMILLKYNHLQPDVSLLSINAIQKSLNDQNCINRSLAIRCLSGIKIPAILPILLLSLGKMVKDSSPLVRSSCAVSILKCIRLDLEFNKDGDVACRDYIRDGLADSESVIYQLSTYLDILLCDNDAKVLSVSIEIYYEVFNGFYDLLHNKVGNIISHLKELDSFAIVNILDILTEYIQLFYSKFDRIDESPNEIKKLYDQLEDLVKYEMNANVILSIIRIMTAVFRNNLPNMNKIAMKLIQRDYDAAINEESKILYGLECIEYLIDEGHIEIRDSQLSHFYPLVKDPITIFEGKVRILYKVVKDTNYQKIIGELEDLICMSTNERKTKLAIKYLNKLITPQYGDLIIRFYLGHLKENEEYTNGLINYIQQDIAGHVDLLIKLVGELFEFNDDIKASIIWLLGEFVMNVDEYEQNEKVTTLKNYLGNLSIRLISAFKGYPCRLKVGILNFVSKLQIHNIVKDEGGYLESDLFRVYTYLVELCEVDVSIKVREAVRQWKFLLPFRSGYYENERKLKNMQLSVLMYQTEKRFQMAGVEAESHVKKYMQTTSDRLDPEYLAYYEELRSSGFELRDYGRYTSSYTSGGAKESTGMASATTKRHVVADRPKYQLQSLEDFLGS